MEKTQIREKNIPDPQHWSWDQGLDSSSNSHWLGVEDHTNSWYDNCYPLLHGVQNETFKAVLADPGRFRCGSGSGSMVLMTKQCFGSGFIDSRSGSGAF
jgi:hypothetical protein